MRILAFIVLFCLHTKAIAQTGTEIYLFDLKSKKGKITISNPVNITNSKGYDNQPSFDAARSLIYYSSFNEDGRSDIKTYQHKKKETKVFTTTQEREYSPTLTPDKAFVSCIIQRDNNAQDLGKYPIGGGTPDVLIDNLIVGYHLWLDNSHIALFVLGEPNTLRIYLLPTREDTILVSNIGRSLHKIPTERAFSFVHKESAQDWIIKKMDMTTLEITTITKSLPGHEDIAWTEDGLLLTSDGEKIFAFNPAKDTAWREVLIKSNQPDGLKFLKGVTRLAVSGNKLAVVVAE